MSTATTDVATSRRAAKEADPRDIAADPNGLRGANVVLWGKALNVEQDADYTWVYLMAEVFARPDADQPIVLIIRPRRSSIVSDDWYIAYGIVSGTQSVKRLLTGASNDVASLDVYALDPKGAPRDNGTCPVPGNPGL